MFSKSRSKNCDEPALRRKETKEFEWITPFDPTTAREVKYAFEIGQNIGFPTIWMFSMRPMKIKTRSYVGLTVNLLQHPNKIEEGPRKICVSFSTELQRPQTEKCFVTRTIEEDFGTRSTKGMMNFLEMNNLHLYTFPDKTLKMKINFTLFAPFPITKHEIRYKAAKRCDFEILKELSKLEFADTIVKVEDDKEFRVYRIALARSPYFRELLLEQAKSLNGQKQSLPIELYVEKPYDIMKIIICFIHYGHLLEELVDPTKCTIKFAKSLLDSAREFGLPDLAEFLFEFYPGLKSNQEIPNPEAEIPKPNEQIPDLNKEVAENKMMDVQEEEEEVVNERKLVTVPEESD